MSNNRITITVNGQVQTSNVPAARLLAHFLRDDLNLTGTKRGCETGVCGACTILVDGRSVKSCLMLAVQADGCSVTTIEGLQGNDGKLHPLQEAFLVNGGLQCGYCTPGFIMMAMGLLAETPRPDAEHVRAMLNGNLCRCTGYVNIVKSILAAAEIMNENR